MAKMPSVSRESGACLTRWLCHEFTERLVGSFECSSVDLLPEDLPGEAAVSLC